MDGRVRELERGGQGGGLTFDGIKTLRSSSEMGVVALGGTTLGGTLGGTTP